MTGVRGKCPAKNGSLMRDILERNDPFVRVDLNNTVNQKEWIPMRKNPHDLCYSQLHPGIYFAAGASGFLGKAETSAVSPNLVFAGRLAAVGINAADNFSGDIGSIMGINDMLIGIQHDRISDFRCIRC